MADNATLRRRLTTTCNLGTERASPRSASLKSLHSIPHEGPLAPETLLVLRTQPLLRQLGQTALVVRKSVCFYTKPQAACWCPAH